MAGRVPVRLKSLAELRKFGLVVGAAFLVLATIAGPWRGHSTTAAVLSALGVPLLVLGAVAPKVLGPVERAWMGFALTLSKVTTPIFMGMVYFAVITPAGLLRRTLGERLLDTSGHRSTWRDAPPSTSMERQF